MYLIHIFSVDDGLFFGDVSLRNAKEIHEALDLYCKATRCWSL
jgi:hypothetical protein